MTHASLFSGIGGGELAAAWMGWENLFHCEINPFGRRVLEYWFPESKSYDDITKTDFTSWRGRVSVLTGGFPCQPFSLAGKRKGAEDDRYLWPQMLRAIREIQPSWVVGENVAGLATMVQPGTTVDMGRTDDLFQENHLLRTTQRYTLDEIISSLEDSGYSVQPLLIPACAVGAPHRRDRMWIVANSINARVRASKHGRKREGSAQPREGQDRPFGRTGRLGEDEVTPDIASDRGREIHEDVQSEQSNGEKPFCDGLQRTTINSTSERLARSFKCKGFRDSSKTNTEFGRKADWSKFPSVSPVCRGNDGLPFDVDSLTIPETKWRKESIMAMGNAWVPEVAYEIFRAIGEIEED